MSSAFYNDLLMSLSFWSQGKAFACRFFCGPNAKKSAALAKQGKKRPRKGQAKTVDDSEGTVLVCCYNIIEDPDGAA